MHHQPELPLTRDDRAAHLAYLASPPAKAGERRGADYWAGLRVELRSAYPVQSAGDRTPRTGRD